MAGQWKIELVASELSTGGSGTAKWWEDSTTVDTQEHDYAYSASSLYQTTAARTEFLADAVDGRDGWQADQARQASADAVAASWTTILNNNDDQVT